MLWVYADRYGIASSDGRQRFKAISFSHTLSDDQRSGTITLYPDSRVLNIGAGADDYTCVRIFDEGGRDVGTMVRTFGGEVTWHKALGRDRSG